MVQKPMEKRPIPQITTVGNPQVGIGPANAAHPTVERATRMTAELRVPTPRDIRANPARGCGLRRRRNPVDVFIFQEYRHRMTLEVKGLSEWQRPQRYRSLASESWPKRRHG